MARKRGKMALYEVMSKARSRVNPGRAVEPLKPVKKQEQVPIVDKPVAPAAVEKPVEVEEKPQIATKWRKKPRIIQYNLGRFEFSIPYELAITIGLGLVLLLLITFKCGQYLASGKEKSEPAVRTSGNNQNNNRTGSPTGLARTENTSMAANNSNMGSPVYTPPPTVRETAPAVAAPSGKNVIVLAQSKAKAQLEPAMVYFNNKNMPTEIALDGSTYFLQTIERFVDNPSNAGTKGYDVIQKIKELGKSYKAPQGFDSFAPNYFSDAYGKKIEN
jgi:hypothetical protein